MFGLGDYPVSMCTACEADRTTRIDSEQMARQLTPPASCYQGSPLHSPPPIPPPPSAAPPSSSLLGCGDVPP
eukprot:2555656-Prymnesium_polylepis.1